MREHYDQQGLEHPAEFHPPDLLPGSIPIIAALDVLAGDRPVALGYGAIAYSRVPFLAIERYAVRYGINGVDEFGRFCRLFTQADAIEVKAMTVQANKPRT